VFQNTGGVDRKKDDKYWTLLEKWFIFAIIWSIGASVDEDGRVIIDDAIKDIDSGFPHSGTLYEHTVNMEKSEWANWSDKLSGKYTIQPGTEFHKIIVPTIDTLRYKFLLDGLTQGGHNILVVGKTGTGKTLNVNSMLGVLKEETYCSHNINFSA
jgi:dynein heavy chain